MKKVNPSAVKVVSYLVQNGYEAYLVGGAVRDLLLGCEPKDYDITTNATPEEVRAIFGRRNCMVIGRRFRLAQVRIGGEEFEVSTFRRKPTQEERKGRYEDDGVMIWSDNEFGTLEDDVQRRDFTVNALYMDLVGTRGIIDYTGGIQDLKDGIVRTVGDPEERFEEDPVRMLRALKLV
ncbi:MAG: polynucleotide adenylyltransferase PcnB, partial [Victivallales bacterium]|nr:polynucleotide adenylyltransferase PcnB [Victivallales bacterium]